MMAQLSTKIVVAVPPKADLMSTLMWEAVATPEQLDALVDHVIRACHPSAQVYRSGGDRPRVVVIDPTGDGPGDVPAELMARPAHEWPFELVTREVL
jgi:hypothetical protein